MTRPVFRFAPSPNGALHLGHVRSALIGHRMAKAAGGRFLLRIEDIDTSRTRETFVEAILDDLTWLGLDWERPVVRQSQRFPYYRAATERLMELGVLYPCFASRADIAAAADPSRLDPDGAPHYPQIWRKRAASDVAERRAAGEPFALRINMAGALALLARTCDVPLTYTAFEPDGSRRVVAADPARWGDAVIVRKETPTSYHLSVVVDDAWQDVTHVTRGADLLAATDLHRLLQALLDLPPPLYHHHPLVTDAAGRKLSKSAGDTSLRAMRDAGMSRADVIRRALGDD